MCFGSDVNANLSGRSDFRWGLLQGRERTPKVDPSEETVIELANTENPLQLQDGLDPGSEMNFTRRSAASEERTRSN